MRLNLNFCRIQWIKNTIFDENPEVNIFSVGLLNFNYCFTLPKIREKSTGLR